MTENKGGPVKPPVIDLSARESGSARVSEDKPAADKSADAAAKPADKGPTDTPERGEPRLGEAAEPNAAIGGTLALGVVGGGLLGLAAAYGLAWAGLWPNPPDARLSALDRLEAGVSETSSQIDGFETRIAALETSSADLQAALAESGEAAPDSSELSAEIAALEERLAAVETSGAAGEDGAAVTEIQGALDALTTQIGELEARVGTQEGTVAALTESVSATEAAVSSQPQDIGAAVQLPLILAGFESAVAGGDPFLAELDALRRSVPELEVSQAVLDAAGTGLPRSVDVEAAFEAVLPAMLASRPADPNASWQEATADWFRSMLALRPTGEVAGDGPEAVMSRLESAMARRDFRTADELLAQLPQPMLAAAGEVPAMVAAHADAARLIDTVRRQALTLAQGAQS